MSLGILTNEFIPLDQPNRPSPKGVNMPLKKKKNYIHIDNIQKVRDIDAIQSTLPFFFSLLYLPATKLCDYKPTLLVNPKHN